METKKEDVKIVDESWYSIYVVWGITVSGLISLIFGNVFFKIIGVVIIIMGLGVMTTLAKKRKEESINKEKEVM